MVEFASDMITSIEAKNFKCFGEKGIHLDFAPLTILVGPNGSGKSSALDAVGLLSQTAEKRNQQTFTWRGFWADFGGDGRFAFHKRDPGIQITLAVGITNGEGLAEWQRERNLFGRLEHSPRTLGYFVQHTERSEEWLHRLIVDGKVLAERQHTLAEQQFTSRRYNDVLAYPSLPPHLRLQFNPTSSANAPFLSGLFTGHQRSGQMTPDASIAFSVILREAEVFLDYIGATLVNRLFIVGADRAVRETRLEPPPDALSVGRQGQYTLALLSIVFAKSEHAERASKIREWADVFGLAKLGGGWTGGKQLEAGYYDSKSQTPLPTNYAGFGSQQILPVIVQIFAAPRGSTIVIEEPEISLHPEAQVNLIRMFADAIRSGRQIIISTHSPTLLLALSQGQSDYGLTPEKVAIYHFSRETEESVAKRLDLDDKWYIRGWVPSFSQVESQLLQQWMANVRERIGNES